LFGLKVIKSLVTKEKMKTNFGMGAWPTVPKAPQWHTLKKIWHSWDGTTSLFVGAEACHVLRGKESLTGFQIFLHFSINYL
jgi:hypothetical protein